MLQNITRNYDEGRNNAKSENSEGINYSEIISRLFTKQNIAIYILTLMISMVGFGSESSFIMAPFGIALVAAAISNGVPIALVFLSSLIGTAIKFGVSTTFMYVLSSAVLLISVLIKKPIRNEEETEQLKLGGYLFFSVLFVSITKSIFSGLFLYDIMVSLILSVSIYIFYKIFVNSLNVISEYGIKTVFSIEEIIGASLLITIAISAIGELSIFSFSIKNIVCIFIVLLLGWRNGILVGGISGITVGIVLGIIGTGNPILIAAYAISGMLAGLLNKFGKIGVILGFIIGNILIAYSANGGTRNIIMFQEILIAAIGLLAVPKKTKINIEEIIPKTKLLPESTGRIEESADTILKLNSISKTIDDISKNYQNESSYENNLSIFEDQLMKEIEGKEENLLYDYIYDMKDKMSKDIFDNIVENRILTDNSLIAILAKNNIFIMNSDDKDLIDMEQAEVREMTKIINTAFLKCKSDMIWQKKIEDQNKNMSKQLNNVKKAIDDITTDITGREDSHKKFTIEENEIKMELTDCGINVKDVAIKKETSGRYIVNVFSDICDEEIGTNCPVKKIQKGLGKTLNDKFTIQDQKCGIRLNKDTCQYTYISDDKYYIQTAVATVKKDGSIVSGDVISRTRLGDGKYLLAISDGMGSGPEARKNSKISISMLERLLSSGFDKETSLNLINSAILANNQNEGYATLDIEILDLFAGNMQLIKSGACPTYLKKKRKVSMIKSESLPAGIMKDLKIDTFDKDIEDKSIIVMCSDGVIESNKEFENRELWIKYLLEEIQTDIPERIANIILKEAIDNDFGKPKDDMSIVVTKIIKK